MNQTNKFRNVLNQGVLNRLNNKNKALLGLTSKNLRASFKNVNNAMFKQRMALVKRLVVQLGILDIVKSSRTLIMRSRFKMDTIQRKLVETVGDDKQLFYNKFNTNNNKDAHLLKALKYYLGDSTNKNNLNSFMYYLRKTYYSGENLVPYNPSLFVTNSKLHPRIVNDYNFPQNMKINIPSNNNLPNFIPFNNNNSNRSNNNNSNRSNNRNRY